MNAPSDYLQNPPASESPTPVVLPPPPAKSILEFIRADPANNTKELLMFRFLCRGAGMLFIGPTGVGKSAWEMQAAILWALGKEFGGFKPPRPLKSLIIQAENDDDDMAEFRDGVLAGLHLTTEELQLVRANVIVATEDSRTGARFLSDVVDQLLTLHKPDIMWIDPVLSYLGGDSSSQQEVSAFLRNGLNPLLHRHDCACVLVCHPAKPSNSKDKKGLSATELAYSALGSVEWANWARAIVVLVSTGGFDFFRLVVSKRGQRLRWTNGSGTKILEKTIAHAPEPGVICWHEADEQERITATAKKSITPEDLLALVPSHGAVPKNLLLDVKAPSVSIGQKKARGLLDQLLKDGLLFIWKQPRSNTGPLISVSRHQQPPPPETQAEPLSAAEPDLTPNLPSQR